MRIIIHNRSNLPSLFMETKFSAFDYLLAHGIKPSVQRMAVADFLNEYRTHPTADDIYLGLLPTMPTLSKTTIYNTLNLFLERGAVMAINIDEKNVRFDIETTDHAHFRCESCDRLYDLFDETVAMPKMQLNNGFKVNQTHLYLKGICLTCLKKYS